MDNAIRQRLESLLENTLWTHKILEKQEEIYSGYAKKLQVASIVFVALTSTGVLTIIFGSFWWATIATAVIATVSLAVTIWREATDYGQKAANCSVAAKEYLSIRIRIVVVALHYLEGNSGADPTEIDKLEEQYSLLCKMAPRTTPKAVSLARSGLADGDSRVAQEVLESLRNHE